MSFDPRDLDERGLLLCILQELQSIRQLLEEQAPAEVTISQAVTVAEPELPVRKWRIELDFRHSMDGADAFMRANPNVLRVLSQHQEPVTGGLTVVYEGRYIDGAKEA